MNDDDRTRIENTLKEMDSIKDKLKILEGEYLELRKNILPLISKLPEVSTQFDNGRIILKEIVKFDQKAMKDDGIDPEKYKVKVTLPRVYTGLKKDSPSWLKKTPKSKRKSRVKRNRFDGLEMPWE